MEDLYLTFAKKASAFNSWFENAEEDLTDPVRCNSVEEIKVGVASVAGCYSVSVASVAGCYSVSVASVAGCYSVSVASVAGCYSVSVASVAGCSAVVHIKQFCKFLRLMLQ